MESLLGMFEMTQLHNSGLQTILAVKFLIQNISVTLPKMLQKLLVWPVRYNSMMEYL
jgi:hypothetical protein